MSRATQSSTEKLRPAGTRSEMEVPGDGGVPSRALTWSSVGELLRVNEGHNHRPNPQFDIFPTVTFVTALSPKATGCDLAG